MPRIKAIGFPIIITLLVFAFSAESFSQATTGRRRVRKQELSKFELYFDGGYSMFDMAGGTDALEKGAQVLADSNYFDLREMYMGATYTQSRTEFKSIRTMGGGMNFNINRNVGIGLKIQFAQVEGMNVDKEFFNDIVIEAPGIQGSVLIDQLVTYSSKHLYTYAPIIIKAFYTMTPIAAMPGMEMTIGGGPGVYTTTVEIFNNRYDDYVDYPPELFNIQYFENFIRYTDSYVAKPIGLHLFGGISIRGSRAISLLLEAEYNYVPETTIDADGWGEPGNMEHNYGIDNDEEIREYFLPMFNDYHPDKLNMSNFRISGAIKFSF